MKRLALMIATLSLCSCVTMERAKIKKTLDSWIGQPESKLVQEWGLPDSQMTNDAGDKIYEYRKTRSATIPAPGTPFGVIGSVIHRYTFNIGNGVIVSNSYRRN